MKHKIVDGVDVHGRVSVDIPTEDVVVLIDKATDAAITIITAYTVAHVFRSIFK